MTSNKVEHQGTASPVALEATQPLGRFIEAANREACPTPAGVAAQTEVIVKVPACRVIRLREI